MSQGDTVGRSWAQRETVGEVLGSGGHSRGGSVSQRDTVGRSGAQSFPGASLGQAPFKQIISSPR